MATRQAGRSVACWASAEDAMDAWTLLRLLKFVGVAAFAGGVVTATSARDERDRIDGAWGLAPIGLFLTWVAGFGLLKVTNRSMGQVWIGAGILLSYAAVHVAMLSNRDPGGRRRLEAATWALFGATVGVMVARDLATWWAFGLGAGALCAAASGLRPGARAATRDPAGAARVLGWFWWLARAEGLSALALFGVYMPLKYGAGVVLDGGAGAFGWVHGVLFLLYVNALPSAARAGKWSGREVTEAVAASMMPLGGIVLERRRQSGEGIA